MKFDFKCSKCDCDKWKIEYDTEESFHTIMCVNCGYSFILEEVMGRKRPKKKTNKEVKKIETNNINQTN